MTASKLLKLHHHCATMFLNWPSFAESRLIQFSMAKEDGTLETFLMYETKIIQPCAIHRSLLWSDKKRLKNGGFLLLSRTPEVCDIIASSVFSISSNKCEPFEGWPVYRPHYWSTLFKCCSNTFQISTHLITQKKLIVQQFFF